MGNLAAHLFRLHLIVGDRNYRHSLIFQLVGAKLGVQSAKSLTKCTVLSKLPLTPECHLHTICLKEALCKEQFSLQLVQVHRCVCMCACCYYCQRLQENLVTTDPDVLLHLYLFDCFPRQRVLHVVENRQTFITRTCIANFKVQQTPDIVLAHHLVYILKCHCTEIMLVTVTSTISVKYI